MIASDQFVWWRAGECRLGRVIEGLTEDSLDGSTLVPEWNRRTLVAHCARNADALVNLLTWAETGVETPMYRSSTARDADIKVAARQPAAALFTDSATAATRLRHAVQLLPEPAWSALVQTAQGRWVPASTVVWMRCREVWVHAADLDVGVGLDSAPLDFLIALVDDVFEVWQRRQVTPPLRVCASDTSRQWGADAPTAVARGATADLAGWLTGRTAGANVAFEPAPVVLPAWL